MVIGPRSGSRTGEFAIPPELPPGPLQGVFPGKVARVESLRPGLTHEGEGWAVERWLEHLETEAEAELVAADGRVACWRHGRVRYLAAWPEEGLAREVLSRAARAAGLATLALPEGLRLRRTREHVFLFNYNAQSVDIPAELGGGSLEPASVAVR